MAGRASWHGCALIALILLLPAASPSLCWSAGDAFMNDPAAAFAPWSPAVSAVLEANLLYLEGRPSASPWAGSGRRPRLCGQTPGPAGGGNARNR